MAEPASAEPSAATAASGSASGSPPLKQSGVEETDFAKPIIKLVQSSSRRTSTSGVSSTSREGTPPPLPPRPKNLGLLDSRPSTSHSVAPTRPQLISKATTQLSYADSHTVTNDSRDQSPSSRASKSRSFFGLALGASRNASDVEDSASIRSVAQTPDMGADVESILGEVIGDHEKSLLRSLGHKIEQPRVTASLFPLDPELEAAFETEFDEVEEMKGDGSNEGKAGGQSLFLERVRADSLNRSCYAAVAREAEAFPHPFECGQANIQSAWR